MSKFYAVVIGRCPGIYTDWNSCQAQTLGYKGAIFKSFPTYKQAEAYLLETLTETLIRTAYFPEEVEEPPSRKENCIIYSDGGHNKLTGKVAFGCVVNGKGKDLLQKYNYLFTDLQTKEVVLPVGQRLVLIADFSDVTTQQNNGAELLAFYAGLRIAKENNKYQILCCDSQVIVEYWSKKLPPQKAAKMCPRKVEIIGKTILLRKEFEKNGGKVEKISGNVNPADLGYHK